MKDINADNVFAKYVEAIEKKDHAEVKRLEQAAEAGVKVKKTRVTRHVSLRQIRAITRGLR